MVFAQDADAVGEHLLEQGNGLGETACLLVYASEVVARGECAGMVFAQDDDAVGDELLVHTDGLAKAPCGRVRPCDGSRTSHVLKI